jgi:hypothetical protein
MKKSNVCKIALCLLWAGMVDLQGVAQSTDYDAIHRCAIELVAKMTVEEKVGQLNQVSGLPSNGSPDNNFDRAIEQGQVGSILWLIDVKEINRLQHLAVEKCGCTFRCSLVTTWFTIAKPCFRCLWRWRRPGIL